MARNRLPELGRWRYRIRGNGSLDETFLIFRGTEPMPAAGTVYLVVRRDDGFGDVFPLTPGQRYTLGRAQTNRIVLKDELCSREHAEIYHTGGRWRVRDLESLNGSRLNGDKLTKEVELSPGDEVHLGRTTLLFVEDMEQLPDLPPRPPPSEAMSIKKRLGQTRHLTLQKAAPRANRASPVSRPRATASAATSPCSTAWLWTWAPPPT
jgi:hypothetical protein